MTPMHRRVRQAARRRSLPKREDREHTSEPVRDPGGGEVLVRMEQRGALRDAMPDRIDVAEGVLRGGNTANLLPRLGPS